MDTKTTKTITILLTRYADLFGLFIMFVCRNAYSHASISIDPDEEIFYSFNYKGVVIEKPKKRKPKTRMVGSVMIRMSVPLHVYQMIETEIAHFLEKKEQYAYTRLGVLLCLFNIPHQFTNHYFCSQFVAEILEKTGAFDLKKKHSSLYLPGHLLDEIECIFSKKSLKYNVI